MHFGLGDTQFFMHHNRLLPLVPALLLQVDVEVEVVERPLWTRWMQRPEGQEAPSGLWVEVGGWLLPATCMTIPHSIQSVANTGQKCARTRTLARKCRTLKKGLNFMDMSHSVKGL